MRAAGIQHSRDNVQVRGERQREPLSVEVWRGDKRVAQVEINVTLNEERFALETERVRGANRITNVPPMTSTADMNPRDIAVRSANFVPTQSHHLWHEFADTWYIQPIAEHFEPIAPRQQLVELDAHRFELRALLVRQYDSVIKIGPAAGQRRLLVARTVVEWRPKN